MAKRKEDRNNNGNIHPKRIFKTPKDLYNAFTKYKVNRILEADKWPKVQYVGKDGERVTDSPVLPLTMDGFEVFCYDTYGVIDQYLKNQDGYYDEFIPICTRIRKEIRDNQITGGMLSQFNASITQRLNNLEEKTATNNKVQIEGISTEDLEKGLQD